MWIFENDYALAWTLYLAGALGCLLAGFQLTRWMWRWLREVLRLVFAVLLFTPTVVEPERMLFAPALAITALDLLFGVGNNAWRAVSDLALYGLIGFGLYLVFVLLRWGVGRLRRPSQAPAANEPPDDPRTLRERLRDPQIGEPDDALFRR